MLYYVRGDHDHDMTKALARELFGENVSLRYLFIFHFIFIFKYLYRLQISVINNCFMKVYLFHVVKYVSEVRNSVSFLCALTFNQTMGDKTPSL